MRLSLLSAAGFILFLLSACGPGNTVKLLPPPPLQASSLPAPSAPSVCVVNFDDKRMEPEIVGARRDNSSFVTSGDVPLWISRALADDLARQGFRVTFAMTANQARSSNPDYMVTGAVQEVWLKEINPAEMSAQMRIDCALANRKGRLWSESCSTSQTKAGLPSGSFADNMLLETMKELVKPAAQKITQTIEAK